MLFRSDYAAAGVPMLPNVIGDAPAARVILLHTVVLVAVSLLPIAFGAGWIYFLAAAGGGSLFLYRTSLLARAPSKKNAFSAFHASLVQLTLVLVGVVLGRWIGF